MKPLSFTGRPGAAASADQKLDWIMDALGKIELASKVDALVIAQAYTVTNPPASPVRTLTPATATVTQLANVVAALLRDLQRGGPSS